jgi:DHA1 family bicyclomycin/chloramphenicol resistance-like MFS transporter
VFNSLGGFVARRRVPVLLFMVLVMAALSVAGSMFGNAFAMANASAGAISIRPQAAGTAAGAMGFLQMGFGSLCSQVGAFLGGQFTTPLPLNIAILAISASCAAVIVLLVPRSNVVVTTEAIREAEEKESGLI